MTIPTGQYTFRVVRTRINEFKSSGPNAGKKYVLLNMEISNSYQFNGYPLVLSLVPWNNFNWMNNIRSFFTEHEIEVFLLENPTDATLTVVSQLIIGYEGLGQVKESVHFPSKTKIVSVTMNGRCLRD